MLKMNKETYRYLRAYSFEPEKKDNFPYYHENNKIKLINEDVFENKYPEAYKCLQAQKEVLAARDKGNGNNDQ